METVVVVAVVETVVVDEPVMFVVEIVVIDLVEPIILAVNINVSSQKPIFLDKDQFIYNQLS
jgi:hypothetical protein